MFKSICNKCSRVLNLPWEDQICTQCRLTTVPVQLPEPLTGIPHDSAQIRNLTDYYIYLWWIDPLPYPVYVGKGTGSRWSDRHVDPATNVIAFSERVRRANKDQFRVTISRHAMAEPHAYELERYLIHEAVQRGEQLLNRCAGGGTATDLPPTLVGDVPSAGLMAHLLSHLPRNRTLVSVQQLAVDGLPFHASSYIQTLARGGMLKLQGEYASIPDAGRLKKLYRIPDARKSPREILTDF